MNAVEIEEAISQLALEPFDRDEFPFLFLEAFGNKATTIKRLKSGATNGSDLEGGVLQRSNIHIATCDEGAVGDKLTELRESPATSKGKVKFILATDGVNFEAEDLNSGETVACEYKDFPDHFGFFLQLAGISTVKQIRENAFDIKATSRLNRLYIELLRKNPEWGTAERRHDMNHFMARLIFCFFAEDTDIFEGEGLFTDTIDKMSERDSSNTHEIISEIFRAMDVPYDEREDANLPRWANAFPYVNGDLFSGSVDTPKFSKIARSYLVHIGNLDWTKINPDIFGSMIQAVTDEEERGALGLHYTSVPNILKVLNPLFLDDIREKLEQAGDNPRMLLNLRKRISKIRVFDPACGSGNFLVIAYKELRAIEAEINRRRGEEHRRSEIPLTNFRGIELRDFPAEVARLALIIAEYQCDEVYRGQKEALDDFLPLDATNWIINGNALRLDWLSICPPHGTAVNIVGDDLFGSESNAVNVDFANDGGETYLCGNPPYRGSSLQTSDQKADLEALFGKLTKSWKNFDYIAGWFIKASEFIKYVDGKYAFVSTNSICQGQQVPMLWPLIYENDQQIDFAFTSFKWSNLASYNAGVIVIIVGVSSRNKKQKKLFVNSKDEPILRVVSNINPYLVPAGDSIVEGRSKPLGPHSQMLKGNQPTDGGHLCLNMNEAKKILQASPEAGKYIYHYIGSKELIRGEKRYCIWVSDSEYRDAIQIESLAQRFKMVAQVRRDSSASTTRPYAEYPYRFRQIQSVGDDLSIIIPSVSSESREYLPVGVVGKKSIVSNLAFAIYDAPLFNLSLIASKLHKVWISTVCGKLKTDFRYSNVLGWNTFPVPKLTEKNKEDLCRCAENILIARESHFPATIAELYNADKMPLNLRAAHDHNDEVIERIYIGRCFKNDTERLEKLFELYAKMTAEENKKPKSKKKAN